MLDDRDAVVKFYQDNLAEHGYTPRGMAWRDEPTHYQRLYDAMYLTMVLEKRFGVKTWRVLDVGCGIGMLPKEWRLKTYPSVTYHGIDLVPEYIDKARDVNADYPDAVFWCGDLQDYTILEPYHVTLAIGTIAWQQEETVYNILTKMWQNTKEGGIMLFTFLPSAPLSMFDVNIMKRQFGVERHIYYSGYTPTQEIMVAFQKGVQRG